jgi:hypothetical protein
MTKLALPVLLIALSALAATAPAAPVPDAAKGPVLFFPTTKGTRWVYRLPNGSLERQEVTRVITGVEWVGKEARVTVSTLADDGRALPLHTLRVSADGVFTVAEPDGRRIDPPVPRLKSPLSPGAEWELAYGDTLLRATVGKAEEVVVPAGRYRAVRVGIVIRLADGTRVRMTEWYAAGIGLIREMWDRDTMQELKSFTPGKE